MTAHDAAYLARQIGQTTNWVKRHAQQLPHSRAGRAYFWTDEDVAAVLRVLQKRPDTPEKLIYETGLAKDAYRRELRPIPPRARAPRQ